MCYLRSWRFWLCSANTSVSLWMLGFTKGEVIACSNRRSSISARLPTQEALHHKCHLTGTQTRRHVQRETGRRLALPSPMIRALSSLSRYWTVCIFTSPSALPSSTLLASFISSACFFSCAFKLPLWGLMSLTGMKSSSPLSHSALHDACLDLDPDLLTRLGCRDVEGVWCGVWSCESALWNLLRAGWSLTPEWATGTMGWSVALGVVMPARWETEWQLFRSAGGDKMFRKDPDV